MSKLQVFAFGDHRVRTAGTFEAPLFCAADVCAILTLGHVSKACERIDPDDVVLCHHDPGENKPNALTVRGTKRSLYVTESGLYALILGCEKPEARAFKKWVTSEVLPGIRKRGYYDALEAERNKTTERLLAEIFPSLPSKSQPIFRELIAALVRLRREGEGPNPPWARSLASDVYRWSIPVDGQQQHRCALSPHPNGSRVDHSMLSEPAREHVRQVAHAGAAFARISVSWQDWKAKMELAFGTRPLQLPFLVPMLEPPKKDEPEAAE